MRDKVVLGLATDFRAGTHAGPDGFGLCVRLGMRRVLTRAQLSRLVSVYRRPGGQAFAAQALNALAAPIGAECGGAKFVPELIGAAEALGGEYPLSRLDIAARRLGIGYGPYLGVRCARPGSTHCDQVGIDVVLHREAAAVTAWVGGAEAPPADPRPPQRRRRAGLGRLPRPGRARPARKPLLHSPERQEPGHLGRLPGGLRAGEAGDRLPERRPGPRHAAAGLSQPRVGMRGARKTALASLLVLAAIGVARNGRLRVGRRLLFGAVLRQPSIRIRARAARRLAPGAGPSRPEAARPPGDPLGRHLGAAGRRRRRLRPRTGGRDRADEARGRPALDSGVHGHGGDALAYRDRRSSASPRHCDRGADPAPGAPPTWRTDPCARGPLDRDAALHRRRAAGSTPSSTSGAGRRRRGCARCGRSSRACASARG